MAVAPEPLSQVDATMHAPHPIRRILIATIALVGAWIPAATVAAPHPQHVVRLDPVVVEAPAPETHAILLQSEA